MKKLIPMMVAAACAFGVYADGFKTVSDFEGSTPGETLDPTSDTLWSSEDTDGTLTFTAYVEADKKYTYGEQTVIAETGVGKNYLAVDNSKPLYRNAADGDEKSIASEDLYIDTLVKFTVTDADTTPEADTNAKLALWLQAGENEGDAPVFKIRCGKMEGGVLGTQDITIAAPEEFDAEAWHRLTVRAVKGSEEYDGVAIAEFEVFLDGEALQEETVLACVAGTGLTGVGFKGNGAIDDVSFTDVANAPTFAIPPATDITVTWTPAEIAGLAYGETTLTAEELAKGTIDVAPGTTFTVTFAKGYMGDASQKFDEAGEIVAQKVAFTDAENNEFASLADAIADGTGTITLAGDYTLAEEIVIESGDKVIDLAGATITIDGINMPEGGDAFYVEGGSLTIVDSVGGGKIVAAADQVETIIYNEGSVVIGSEEGEAPTFEGAKFLDGDDAEIYKGAFDAENNAKETIAGMLADAETLEAVEEDGYIVVKAKGGPDPEPTALTSIELSATLVEYGTETAPTATVKAGETTVDAANYDITYEPAYTATTAAGTTITVTATAKEGTDYTGSVYTTFTVEKKSVTPEITLSATTAEFSDTLELPTVTVDGYTLDTDYAVAWDKSLPETNPEEDVVLTVTVTMEGNYTGTNTATFTVTPKKGGALPGDDYMAEGEKTAYDEWANATGVTAEDTELAADLAVAFRLEVTGTETPADAIAAADAKATDLVKKIDLAKLASGEDALAAVKAELPAGLQAVLKPVEKTEIDTTASLFRLVIEPVNAN